MIATRPVKLYINERNWIIAIYPDGHNTVWGDCQTAVGAKRRLSYWAKRLGLTIQGSVAE